MGRRRGGPVRPPDGRNAGGGNAGRGCGRNRLRARRPEGLDVHPRARLHRRPRERADPGLPDVPIRPGSTAAGGARARRRPADLHLGRGRHVRRHRPRRHGAGPRDHPGVLLGVGARHLLDRQGIQAVSDPRGGRLARPTDRLIPTRGRSGTPTRPGYTRIWLSSRADVAQLVEHFTRNEGVPGSSPGVGFLAYLQGFCRIGEASAPALAPPLDAFRVRNGYVRDPFSLDEVVPFPAKGCPHLQGIHSRTAFTCACPRVRARAWTREDWAGARRVNGRHPGLIVALAGGLRKLGIDARQTPPPSARRRAHQRFARGTRASWSPGSGRGRLPALGPTRLQAAPALRPSRPRSL